MIVSVLCPTYHRDMAKKATSKPKGIIPSNVRNRSPRALSQTIDKLTKSMLGRHGLTRGTILTKWPDIIGEDLSRHTSPEKIVFMRDGVSGGVLHLRCDSGSLATELLHREPQILDRINTFFGYLAVVRVKLIQAPMPYKRPERIKPSPPLTALQTQDLSKTIAIVDDDDELRQALEKLGTAILKKECS